MAITNLYIDFDFIKTRDCKTLKIVDQSNWSIYEEEDAFIEITKPGYKYPVTFVFQKGKINVFNSINLNSSDSYNYSSLAAITDGIYTVTVTRCKDDAKAVTKYYLQDCSIRCRLANKLLSLDLTCEPCKKDFFKEIQDITLFLDAAQAQVSNCNINKAIEYYQRASLILSRIDEGGECKTCH